MNAVMVYSILKIFLIYVSVLSFPFTSYSLRSTLELAINHTSSLCLYGEVKIGRPWTWSKEGVHVLYSPHFVEVFSVCYMYLVVHDTVVQLLTWDVVRGKRESEIANSFEEGSSKNHTFVYN